MVAAAQAQLAVNFTDIHHTTHIWYPDLELVDHTTEEFILLPPVAQRDRYMPSDLIADPVVAYNASIENRHETSFFTIERANGANPSPTPALLDQSHPAIQRLIHDVAVLQHTVGDTYLHVTTYTPIDAVDSDTFVRVKRRSRYRHVGGGSRKHVLSYEFRLDDLVHFINSASPPMFISSIMDLVWRVSDRAFRHVRGVLAVQGMDDSADYTWQKRPDLNYEEAISRAITPVSPSQLEDENCSICHRELNHQAAQPALVDHSPVRTHCGHVFGRSCILKWLTEPRSANNDDTVAPTEACCAMCRQRILSLDIAKSIAFGLAKGLYTADYRFNPFEHFERSCADLDDHVDDDMVCTTIRGDAIKRAWQYFLAQAKDEPASSTPLQLQPVRFPEMAVVSQAVCQWLDERNGPNTGQITVDQMLRTAMKHTRVEMLDRADTPEFCQFLHGEWEEYQGFIEADESNDYPSLFPVRPGIEQYVRRTLGRAIYFQRKRACNCKLGFHKHGLRMYYNARNRY